MSECVDHMMLDELVEIMGDDMQMLIESYSQDTKEKLIQMQNLNPTHDQDAIFRLAHSLKGSSRNVGVTAFANYCEEIEETAKNGELKAEDLDCEKLNSLFEQALAEINNKFS